MRIATSQSEIGTVRDCFQIFIGIAQKSRNLIRIQNSFTAAACSWIVLVYRFGRTTAQLGYPCIFAVIALKGDIAIGLSN